MGQRYVFSIHIHIEKTRFAAFEVCFKTLSKCDLNTKYGKKTEIRKGSKRVKSYRYYLIYMQLYFIFNKNSI